MIAYIKEIEKIKLKNKIFNLIEKIKDTNIYCLPINKETKEKKVKKIAIKLCEFLVNENIRNVVLSDNLLNQEILCEFLHDYRINLLKGNRLDKIMLLEIIQVICEYKNVDLDKQRISILINEYDEIIANNIIDISQKIKNLNIITNNSNKFNKITNYLYEDLGILIRVSNNLKRDLLNSNIIINVDFEESLINKYNINPKAIIFNIPENININSKKFIGININSYNIIIPEEYIINGFNDKTVYESMIYNINLQEATKIIRKDDIKIKNFIGKNGIINKEEFLIN